MVPASWHNTQLRCPSPTSLPSPRCPSCPPPVALRAGAAALHEQLALAVHQRQHLRIGLQHRWSRTATSTPGHSTFPVRPGGHATTARARVRCPQADGGAGRSNQSGMTVRHHHPDKKARTTHRQSSRAHIGAPLGAAGGGGAWVGVRVFIHAVKQDLLRGWRAGVFC